MKYLSIISGILLLALVFFSWGYSAGVYMIFPGPKIKQISDEVTAFVQGGETNKKSVVEKLANDVGIRPERMLVDLQLNKNRAYQPLQIEGLKKRRSLPLAFANGEKAFSSGYLLIWGAFDFIKHIHGGILIDENGRVVHSWMPDNEAFISEIHAYNKKLTNEDKNNVQYIPPEGIFPHGLAVYPDGSLIFNDGDHGNGMQKIDFCSNVLWIKLGNFNHTISKDNGGTSIWVMDASNKLHKIDAVNGTSQKLITVEDIMKSNEDCDILSIKRDLHTGKWLFAPWHFNDIEPLPIKYENDFPMFTPGDLLLSMRSLHAIMVVDPNSKKIKWWRSGAFTMQHDPDWKKNGLITVYDNKMRDQYSVAHYHSQTRFSRIVSIDVDNYETEVLYDGKIDNFYSEIRGKHQLLSDGHILITSPMQGRVFIVNGNGETIYEYVNAYDSNNAMLVSEAIWLPKDFFNFNITTKKCSGYNAGESLSKWHPGQNLSLHYSAPRIELKRRIASLQPLPFTVKFSFQDNPFLVFEGWSHTEGSFRWSEGHEASLLFKPSEKLPGQKILVQLSIHSLGRQEIRVSCNGEYINTLDVDTDKPKIISFRVPVSLIKPSEVNMIKFEFPGARTPDSPDPRILAMALHGIEFDLEQN